MVVQRLRKTFGSGQLAMDSHYSLNLLAHAPSFQLSAPGGLADVGLAPRSNAPAWSPADDEAAHFLVHYVV